MHHFLKLVIRRQEWLTLGLGGALQVIAGDLSIGGLIANQ